MRNTGLHLHNMLSWAKKDLDSLRSIGLQKPSHCHSMLHKLGSYLEPSCDVFVWYMLCEPSYVLFYEKDLLSHLHFLSGPMDLIAFPNINGTMWLFWFWRHVGLVFCEASTSIYPLASLIVILCSQSFLDQPLEPPSPPPRFAIFSKVWDTVFGCHTQEAIISKIEQDG